MTEKTKKRARSEKAKSDRRMVLLDAALGLFAENGFNDTKIESITERAGLSTGSFYLYFKSKTDVYRELYTEGMDMIGKYFNETVIAEETSAIKKISDLANSYYKFYCENNNYYKILYVSYLGAEKYFTNDEKLDLMNQKAKSLLEIIRNIITLGIESGEIKTSIDPWKTAACLWGALDGILFLNEKGNLPLLRIDHKEILEQSIEIIINGLRVKE